MFGRSSFFAALAATSGIANPMPRASTPATRESTVSLDDPATRSAMLPSMSVDEAGPSERGGPPSRLDERSRRLAAALLSAEEAEALETHGSKTAGVLVPVVDLAVSPSIVFTERRHDLSRHPGEISFPGGRPNEGEDMLTCALRESHEEIALNPAAVEVVGALQPVSTVVTGYKVSPFVGLISRDLPLAANPAEVERILPLKIEDLLAGFEMRRLVRQGIPFRTPTYTVGVDLVWGATARILQDLLNRLEGVA